MKNGFQNKLKLFAGRSEKKIALIVQS